MGLDNKTISSWVRQARYRAKKHNISSDLTVADVVEMLANTGHGCQYCAKPATTLDYPFPLKAGGPNIPANVVPCCKACKTTKGSNDIVWMYSSGLISSEHYMQILELLFSRRGGAIVKEHVRQAVGM